MKSTTRKSKKYTFDVYVDIFAVNVLSAKNEPDLTCRDKYIDYTSELKHTDYIGNYKSICDELHLIISWGGFLDRLFFDEYGRRVHKRKMSNRDWLSRKIDDFRILPSYRLVSFTLWFIGNKGSNCETLECDDIMVKLVYSFPDEFECETLQGEDRVFSVDIRTKGVLSIPTKGRY